MPDWKKFRRKIGDLWPWITASAAVVASHWFAVSAHEVLTHHLPSFVGIYSNLVIFSVILVIAIGLLYWVRNYFFRPRTTGMKTVKAPQRKHLVIFLSRLTVASWVVDGVANFFAEVIKENRKKGKNKLEEDIESFNPVKKKMIEEAKAKKENLRLWSWEQPLRAIAHHLPVLKTVTIVCSIDTIKDVELFYRMLKTNYKDCLAGIEIDYLLIEDGSPVLVPAGAMSTDIYSGFEFSGFDEICDGLFFLVKKLHERYDAKESQIMIDFTGGKSVVPAVAAAFTINRPIQNEYVDTDPNWEVLGYDLVMGTSKAKEVM